MTEQEKGSATQHLAGGRPWRWVFESMRAALEPSSLVPNLLLLPNSVIHCCAELPPQEVADDISLIVQAVSDRWVPIKGAESARICRLACIFLRKVFQRQQLVFNGDSRLALLHFFQGAITSASTVILLGEDGGAEAGRAKVEAVATLGQFLLLAHNGGFLSMDDVSEVVLFLSGLIIYPVTPESALQSTGRSDSEGHYGSNIDEMEVQRLTFVVMGSLMSQARPLVSGETWTTAMQSLKIFQPTVTLDIIDSSSTLIVRTSVLDSSKPEFYSSFNRFEADRLIQALRAILDSLVSKKALVEDYAASRYYLDLLRCVYILVSKPEDRLKEHVGAFMRTLQMFFRYGLKVSQGEAASLSSISWEEEDMNRPLNHHRKEAFEFPTNDGSVGMPDTAGLFSFDTYEIANDAPVEAAFRDKSSDLRIYSICAIQAMTRADPEGSQKCSGFLLLAENTMQPGSDEATLLTVLRFEPLTKVRMAAVGTLAAMLEFPMYLQHQNADYVEDDRKGLSDSQRQIFLELQKGLVYVILNEKHRDTLVAALNALSRYIATTPFGQLPPDLLSNIVLSISRRLQESNYFLNQSCILVASIACLKTSLSIPPSSIQLCDANPKDPTTGSSNLIASPSLLVDLITCSQPPAPSTVQVQAILALKAAAHNYPGLVAPYWDDIFKALVRIIDSGSEIRSVASDGANLLSSAFEKSASPSGLVQSSRLADDELVQSAIELLDELLRVASDFESPREERDGIILKSQLPEIPEAPTILCSPKLAAQNNASTSDSMVSVQSEEDGSLLWILSLERLLPGVLRHSSPLVRGAGLSCFAGLTPAVFHSLPAPKQEFILSAITRASQYDDTPAVRSAACRAVGVIVGFPQVSKSPVQVASFIKILTLRMTDSLAPERVTVSWVLANLCDGLCSYCTMVDAMEADQFLGHLPLVSLFTCFFKAAKDADIKVCVNVLRSLGNLSRIVNFKTAPYDSSGEVSRCTIDMVEFEALRAPTSSEWLGATVETFLSCVASETVEIQWNLCCAVGKLFQNPSIHLSTSPWAAPLFNLLQSLLGGSENLEVQMHAARALEVPVFREDYGTSFREIVHNLAYILHSLDIIPDTRSANEPAAKKQLSRTLLHVLGLGVSKDYLVLKDVLEDLADFLQRWLSLIVLAVKRAPPQGFESLRLREGLNVDSSEELAPSAAYNGDKLSREVGESEVQRAVEALMNMYMYGGNIITAKKFQRLL